MTREEAIEMIIAKLECMTREVSGCDTDCNAHNCDNCNLCYAQGNMGEQKEWLKLAIEALKNQKTLQEEFEKIIKFEEDWLINIKIENGFISIADIETAMNALRSVTSEVLYQKRK